MSIASFLKRSRYIKMSDTKELTLVISKEDVMLRLKKWISALNEAAPYTDIGILQNSEKEKLN